MFQMEVSYQLSSPPEPGPSSPKSLLVRALEDWDIVTAQALLEEHQHQAWLLEHGWELVPVVCCHLTEHTEEAGPHLTNCCQNILTTLAERVNSPKEVTSDNCLLSCPSLLLHRSPPSESDVLAGVGSLAGAAGPVPEQPVGGPAAALPGLHPAEAEGEEHGHLLGLGTRHPGYTPQVRAARGGWGEVTTEQFCTVWGN